MVFGWFDSTLSTKYLLTKTEKLMKHNKLTYEEYVIEKRRVQEEEAKGEYSIIVGSAIILMIICEILFL